MKVILVLVLVMSSLGGAVFAAPNGQDNGQDGTREKNGVPSSAECSGADGT
jgi:hypothetical protein